MNVSQRSQLSVDYRSQSVKLIEPVKAFVYIPLEDAMLVMNIHSILDSGKNIEIKLDPQGHPKLMKVNKEIVHYAGR